jgi:hypothetical protein
VFVESSEEMCYQLNVELKTTKHETKNVDLLLIELREKNIV